MLIHFIQYILLQLTLLNSIFSMNHMLIYHQRIHISHIMLKFKFQP